jgi:hypothetical protein
MAPETTRTPADFESALEAFVRLAETNANKEKSELNQVTLTIERGRRYCRVVSAYTKASDQRSVFCFVDQDGTILKAESWKKPAKGARGSIFNTDKGAGAVTAYGAIYFAR